MRTRGRGKAIARDRREAPRGSTAEAKCIATDMADVDRCETQAALEARMADANAALSSCLSLAELGADRGTGSMSEMCV
jgi:hypothetical protein